MSGTGKSCCVILSKHRDLTTIDKGKCFIPKSGIDDINLMTSNGLKWEPDTSKGSGFLASLFPVLLCDEFLVVRAWLREKGKEILHTRVDRCVLVHVLTHICVHEGASTKCLHFKQMGLHQCTSVMVPGCPNSTNHFQRETQSKTQRLRFFFCSPRL